ncbi:MAG: hypothetical protein HZB56_06955 [Deltaproteobacteria bacterium]|nr:hypothetical protein [Deltaproteobacteria bacterium]
MFRAAALAVLLLAAGPAAPEGVATSVPAPRRGWLYYLRAGPGETEPAICRRRPAAGAPEERLLEPGGRFSVVAWQPSDDGRRLAYLARLPAGGPVELRVRDLARGEDLPDVVANVGSFAWAADGQTLFFVTLDGAGRGHRLWRHRLGDDPARAAAVYAEQDAAFDLAVRRTRSGAFVLLAVSGKDADEVRAIPASHPRQEPFVVIERQAGRRAAVEHRNEFFLLRLDDRGPGFRLVAAPTGDPRPGRWVEVVPHRPGVLLEEVVALRRFAVARLREGERGRLALLDPRTGEATDLGLPEGTGPLLPARNDDYDALAVRYATPAPGGEVAVHEWDATTRSHRTVGREPAALSPR